MLALQERLPRDVASIIVGFVSPLDHLDFSTHAINEDGTGLRGICADPVTGRVFVSDRDAKKIRVFQCDGKQLVMETSAAGNKVAFQKYDKATFMTYWNNELFVVNPELWRIDVFCTRFELKRFIDVGAKLAGIAVYGDDLFVAGDQYIFKYKTDGSSVFLMEFPGIYTPCGLAMDHSNEIFVTELNRKSVFRCDWTGKELNRSSMSIRAPCSLALDTRFVYVASAYANIPMFVLKRCDLSFVRTIDSPANIWSILALGDGRLIVIDDSCLYFVS